MARRPKVLETEDEVMKLQEQYLHKGEQELYRHAVGSPTQPTSRMQHKFLNESANNPLSPTLQSGTQHPYETTSGTDAPLSPRSQDRLQHKFLTESADNPLSPTLEPRSQVAAHHHSATESDVPLSPTSKERMKHKFLTESTDSPWMPSSSGGDQPDVSGKYLGRIVEKNIDVEQFAFVSRHVGHSQRHHDADVSSDSMSEFAREMLKLPPGTQSTATHTVSGATHDETSLEQIKREVDEENRKRLDAMGQDEIMAEQKAVMEKLDPALVAFLRNRTAGGGHTALAKGHGAVASNVSDEDSSRIEEAILNLELTDDAQPGSHPPRVAVDPMLFDLAQKCHDAAASTRKDVAIERLFAAVEMECKTVDAHSSHFVLESVRKTLPPPNLNTLMSAEELRKLAADNLHHIRKIYFANAPQRGQPVGTVSGKLRLHDHLSPGTNAAWFLEPIVHYYKQSKSKTGYSDPDLTNHTAYCLMWCYLLYAQRSTYFAACITIESLLAKLALVFLLDRDTYSDGIVYNYMGAFMRDVIVPICTDQSRSTPVEFRCDHMIDGVASFETIYGRLLSEFESSSYGDHLFGYYVLMPALCGDVRTTCCLWNVQRGACLQALGIRRRGCLLPDDWLRHMEQHPTEHQAEVVLNYAAALTAGHVQSDRQPLLYWLAMETVKSYVRKFLNDDKQEKVIAVLQRALHKLQQ